MSSRDLILGLLTRQPMSGYDIKRCFETFDWLIRSPSYGSLYPTLHALLEDGLVTVEVVHSDGKPPRKVYSITGAGRQALRKWIGQSEETGSSMKAFLMRLMMAGNLSRADLLAHLKNRRTQVADYRLTLEQTAKAVGEDVDLGERLALDYGLVLAAAEIAWLDGKLARLAQRSLSSRVTRDAPASVAD